MELSYIELTTGGESIRNDAEYIFPNAIKTTYEKLTKSIETSNMMVQKTITAIRLSRKGIGELALLNILKKEQEEYVFLDIDKLSISKHNIYLQIESLIAAIKKLYPKFNSQPNEKVADIILRLKENEAYAIPILWLNLTEADPSKWPLWRIYAENDVCHVVAVVTKNQWKESERVAPEFTSSVLNIIDQTSYLSLDDLSNLKEISRLYCEEPFTDKEIASIRDKLMILGIEKVAEKVLYSKLFEVLLGR